MLNRWGLVQAPNAPRDQSKLSRARCGYGEQTAHDSYVNPFYEPLLIGCPQMTWGTTLENALKSKGISKDFDE